MTTPTLRTTIWEEEAASDDPFTAEACYCRGYNVFGELLERASYPEYLYLLFRGEKPEPVAARVLEILAIALANPGPRDPAVHAAMGAGVSGAPAAAALMSALAVGAGSSGGAREVLLAMERWQRCGMSLDRWEADLRQPPRPTRQEVWPECEHPPGFAPCCTHASLPVLQTLAALTARLENGQTAWLSTHRKHLESIAGCPLAMAGVAAAALSDLAFLPMAGEMLVLLLRLPGAAAHALEQAEIGFRSFPFFAIDIVNDPGPSVHTGTKS